MSAQELAPNQRPAWSKAAALLGFSLTTTAGWAAYCAVPQYQHFLKGKQGFIFPTLGLAAGYYCGGRYTGLTPVETEARFVQLRAEAAQKKIDDELKAAKKAAEKAAKEAKA